MFCTEIDVFDDDNGNDWLLPPENTGFNGSSPPENNKLLINEFRTGIDEFGDDVTTSATTIRVLLIGRRKGDAIRTGWSFTILITIFTLKQSCNNRIIQIDDGATKSTIFFQTRTLRIMLKKKNTNKLIFDTESSDSIPILRETRVYDIASTMNVKPVRFEFEKQKH